MFRICSGLLQMCHLEGDCPESNSAERRRHEKQHSRPPSGHTPSSSQELHLCQMWSLPELLFSTPWPSLVPGLSCLTGWTSDLLCHCCFVWLSLGYSSPTLLSIFRQGENGLHAMEGTNLLALLFPQLLAPCPLQGS